MKVYIASHAGRGTELTPIPMRIIECVVVEENEKAALKRVQEAYNETSIDDWRIDLTVDTSIAIHYNVVYKETNES